MDKLNKIGISALAGTLASFAVAQAGEVSVSGSAEVTYTHQDTDEVTGNPLGSNKNISFAGSGELDNGNSFKIYHAMTDAMSGLSSSSLSVGMGSMGTIAYDSGTGGYGLNAIDNVVPTAWEEADHGLTTGMRDVGAVGTKSTLHWVYSEMDGINFQASYNPRVGSGHAGDGATSAGAKGAGWDFAIKADSSAVGVDGLAVGFGMGEVDNGAGSNVDEEEWTAYATYAVGGFSIGYQHTVNDNGGSNTEHVTDVYGIAFNVNDQFSIGYQYGETEYDNVSSTDVTAEFKGYQMAYTMGPLKIAAVDNEGENHNGTSGTNDAHKEISVSMAF